MGRPPVGKKAMTPAQRQRRYRRKVKRDGVTAEREAKQAENLKRYREEMAGRVPVQNDTPPSPPVLDNAEELAMQILDAIRLQPDVTVADVHAALARLSSPPA